MEKNNHLTSIEVQAKTVDQAIAQALEQLGASYDEVDFEVLNEGGLFKKPKVLVKLKNSPAAEPSATAPITTIKTPKPADEKTSAPQTQTVSSTNAPKKSSTSLAPKFQKTLDFSTELIKLLEPTCSVAHEEKENAFNINITGENVGMIIGKGGEVLNAIQTIVSSIAIANASGEQKRVFVNVADYKERREQTLKQLAQRKAEKVKETGRYIKLEPMNSRDRAIIHGALQGIAGIRTYSTGKEPYRCLCIAPNTENKN